MNKHFLVLAIALGLVACGGSPKKHPELGLPVNLQAAPSFSETAAAGTKTNSVIILSGTKDNNYVEASEILSTQLRRVLGVRGIKVADRDIAAKLKDEIILAANKGTGRYSGPDDVGFATIAYVDSVTASGEYTPRLSRQDKDGNTYWLDPNCDYTTKMTGRIEIREVPSMNLVKQINLEEDDSNKVDNPPNSSCPVSSQLVMGMLTELFAVATTQGDSASSLYQVLSPESYIVGAYDLGGTIYYKTNLGAAEGAKEGRKVELFTKTTDGRLLKFGEGSFISNEFADASSSFISVDKDAASMIQRGTVIKIGVDSCKTLDLKCQVGSFIK